jgi:tetratricopeptide (TPR) repeat protein
MKKLLLSVTAICLLALGVKAQVETPRPSPLSEVEQTVGLTTVEIEYSRPGMKDRVIFGGLVPYNEIWRTGANASTKVEFSDDVLIKGDTLEAGEYALFTIPGEEEWTIIFHNNLETGVWGYDEAEDALRIKVEPDMIKPAVETFLIDVNNIRNSSATIDLVWENTKVSIPFKVMTDQHVMKSIKAVMGGPTASDYYAAARYYYDEDKDMEQAVDWINEAIDKGAERFWVLRLKALIHAKMDDYDAAIAAAKKSKDLAMKADNSEYVKMNEESIKEWNEKKGM